MAKNNKKYYFTDYDISQWIDVFKNGKHIACYNKSSDGKWILVKEDYSYTKESNFNQKETRLMSNKEALLLLM